VSPAVPGLSREIPAAALEPVLCGLCGGAERRLEFAEGPFEVVTCSSCDLTYVTPRLKDASLLQSVYDEGYWSSDAAKLRGYTDYRRDEPLYLRTSRRRWPVIERHCARPGNVLDVGCAAGYFLSVARERGWRIAGFEPSETIRRTAEERLGPGIVRGGVLESAGFAPGSFELVTFWDVLEHVPDPVACLAFARTLLAPGGKLLIETQDVKSLAARALGRRWQHYKHAEHIYHFHRGTIAKALARAGFEVLENRARLGGKFVSLSFVVERAGRVHPILSWLLAPLRALGERALYVNLFDEMIVVARPVPA
jgi:SAM-dependent methyltransferase